MSPRKWTEQILTKNKNRAQSSASSPCVEIFEGFTLGSLDFWILVSLEGRDAIGGPEISHLGKTKAKGFETVF